MLSRVGAVSPISAYSMPETGPAAKGSLGAALQEAARCIQSQPKTRFLTVDFGSFDSHSGQGSGPTQRGGLDWRLHELNCALNGFITDARALGFLSEVGHWLLRKRNSPKSDSLWTKWLLQSCLC